jgi:uncharacterized protein YkwD
MFQLKVLFALAAAATLAACGGGGGDSPAAPPPPAATPSAAPPVGTNGTLQASVAAPNYADARRVSAFNQLNAARQGAGAGLLAQSAALDISAVDHANYLSANGFNTTDSAHDEKAGLIDFTGADPFVRMQDAGYDYSWATEVIGDIGSSSPASDCVGDLLDTVYHAVSMLSRTTDVGFGFGSGTAAGMCTIDMAAPHADTSRQIPASGAIVAYPYGGATVAHGTFHVSNETPRVSTALLQPGLRGRRHGHHHAVLDRERCRRDAARRDPRRPACRRCQRQRGCGTQIRRRLCGARARRSPGRRHLHRDAARDGRHRPGAGADPLDLHGRGAVAQDVAGPWATAPIRRRV